MNLIDALKTGRRIRKRPIHSSDKTAWESAAFQSFDCFDVLSDDWEVEPEPKKKVKRWLWVLNNGDVRPRFYTDVEWHAECVSGKKLEWSETEFEE